MKSQRAGQNWSLGAADQPSSPWACLPQPSGWSSLSSESGGGQGRVAPAAGRVSGGGGQHSKEVRRLVPVPNVTKPIPSLLFLKYRMRTHSVNSLNNPRKKVLPLFSSYTHTNEGPEKLSNLSGKHSGELRAGTWDPMLLTAWLSCLKPNEGI